MQIAVVYVSRFGRTPLSSPCAFPAHVAHAHVARRASSAALARQVRHSPAQVRPSIPARTRQGPIARRHQPASRATGRIPCPECSLHQERSPAKLPQSPLSAMVRPLRLTPFARFPLLASLPLIFPSRPFPSVRVRPVPLLFIRPACMLPSRTAIKNLSPSCILSV